MPDSTFVIPVLFSSDLRGTQTTSAELSTEHIVLRTLQVPRMRARVSMALFLPDGQGPEVVVGEVSELHGGLLCGFTARFVDLDETATARISAALQRTALEHRSLRRSEVDLEVTVSGGRAGRARDISEAGLFFRGAPPGVPEVDLQLALPDGRSPAATRGVVVRSTAEGHGVQFLDFGPAFRERLSRYLQGSVRRTA